MQATWTDLVKRVSLGVMAVGIAFVASGAELSAVVEDVPEVDGASLSAGLGLLGAGILWLRARRRLK